MTELQKNAWLTFKNLVKDFLRNTRAEDYTDIVQELLESFKILGFIMNIKHYFLQTHLDDTQENIAAVSDEHSERFHQDLKLM